MLWEGRGKERKRGMWPGRERRGLFFAWASSNWSRTSIFAIFGANAQLLTKTKAVAMGNALARILTMLMFLLLSYQGDYDIAAPWHLEQIRTDERRHGIIIPDLAGCSVLKHTQTHTLQAKTRGRRARQAASMSNASRHFLSTVIFASPQLVRSIDERFSVFVAYWLDFPACF
jgi:hypothetical protein